MSSFSSHLIHGALQNSKATLRHSRLLLFLSVLVTLALLLGLRSLPSHAQPLSPTFTIKPYHEGQSSPDFSAEAASFRLEGSEWQAKVVDEDGSPVAGAMVYYDGQLITTDGSTPALTDQDGLLTLDNPTPGKPLVAIFQVQEQATWRDAHDGWAYRTYLTSLNLDDEGTPHPDTIGEPGQQLVTIRRDNPLILFNLVVSLQWNANEAYLAMIENAFDQASQYLYDVADGQMAFGQVKIYDNGQYWDHADYKISVKNTVRPYSTIGGITSGNLGDSMYSGRFWSGSSANQGDWDQPNGYRTLIHQFGHYALHLYDEYFVRTVDENGQVTGQRPAACTGIEVIGDDDTATNASIMYYQYNASELADDDRWTINCQNTEQARVNGQSDWQTVLTHYGGPDWVLNTPTSRGSVMAGPEEFPLQLLPFPSVQTHDDGISSPPRQLTVLEPDGRPFSNALVTLYTTPYSDTIAIDQGLTDAQGQITIYGASEGDTIKAASFDEGLAGTITVDERLTYQLTVSFLTPIESTQIYLPIIFRR